MPELVPRGAGGGRILPGSRRGSSGRPQGSRTGPAPRAPPPVPALRPPERALPARLTLIGSGAVPGRGWLPGPRSARACLSLPLPYLARRREQARRLRGGSRAAARSGRARGPTKAARARARPAPAAPGPPPPVTKAGPRPDTGGAREERARLRVAGVNVPDVGRVGVASAPSAAGPARPAPGRGVRRAPWRPRAQAPPPQVGRSAPPGLRLDGRCRSPAPTGPAQAGVASGESWLPALVLDSIWHFPGRPQISYCARTPES